MDKLTIRQAVENGYTLYGKDGHEYQSLHSIADLTDEEIKEYKDNGIVLLIADKEPQIHVTSAKDLMDFAIDDYYNDENFSNDDTQEIDRLIRAETTLFKEFADKLNEIYRKKEIYLLTKIQLVTEEDANDLPKSS